MDPLPCRAPFARRLRGFTLVELMVGLALAVILLGLAAPSFREFTARMRLEGIAHNLATDLQLARSEAIQRRANVVVATAANGASYTLTTGADVLKTVTLPTGATFTANVVITFESLRGLGTATTLTGSVTGSAAQLQVSSDAVGRVQMCSPYGAIRGYATC